MDISWTWCGSLHQSCRICAPESGGPVNYLRRDAKLVGAFDHKYFSWTCMTHQNGKTQAQYADRCLRRDRSSKGEDRAQVGFSCLSLYVLYVMCLALKLTGAITPRRTRRRKTIRELSCSIISTAAFSYTTDVRHMINLVPILPYQLLHIRPSSQLFLSA